MVEVFSGTESALDKRVRARGEYKAWLNEQMFLDARGKRIQNPWHVKEWFSLAEKHDRLLIEASREHGKTSILAVALPLIEMKLNRNIRILIVSDVHPKSTERARLLREHINSNPGYKRFGPHVKIERKTGDYEFTLERDLILKEPTVRSTYTGGPISGSRWDIIVLDDLVTFQINSYTVEQRRKLKRWYADEVLNSVAQGGKIWVIGTKQHHNDLYEDIKKDPSFHAVAYPALDEYGDLGYADKNRDIEGNDAICLWPAMHDYEELAAKREANPDSFMRQQQLIAIPDTGLVYRRHLTDAALERGKEVEYDRQAEQYLGIDPGYGIRCAMLAIQERTGDRIDIWREHSFTELADEDIARTVVAHCEEFRVRAIFIDAEDPGLARAIANSLEARGLSTLVQPVAFAKYKRNAIKATRWLLGSDRVAWKADETIVHKPGRSGERARVEPSLFREEIRDYALKPGTDDEPIKDDDHGPDAWTAYASKWVIPWAKAMGIDLRRTEEQRQYGGLTRVK